MFKLKGKSLRHFKIINKLGLNVPLSLSATVFLGMIKQEVNYTSRIPCQKPYMCTLNNNNTPHGIVPKLSCTL